MLEVNKVWMDGKLVDFKEAKIHVLSHVLHYGSGVFEGLRFYETEKGPAVFRLRDHLKRLFFSAQTLEMEVPFSLEKWEQGVKDLVKVNKLSSGYIRPIIFYGYGKMGLVPLGAEVNCAMAVWPWGAYLGKKEIRVKTSRFIRIHPRSCVCEAKINGYYANSILASLEAHKAGFEEALMLDYQGNVAEGPGENIFMVKNGQLITPSKGAILPGLTRDSVMEFATKELGLELEEKVISPEELKQADEVFFTGTAAEITPIIQVDEVKIGDGQKGVITDKIKMLYLNIVNGKLLRYAKWLTYIS